MRWDNLKIDTAEHEAAARLPGYRDAARVRRFDAPEALGTNFYEVEARSALNRVPEASQMPFRWTVNPYRGCSHACTYCFARPTHEYLGMGAGRDFAKEIVVKVNVPEVLRAELRRPRWAREHVALGTNTDPYQWVESRYRLMEGIWAALRDARNPCSVLTKSPLLLRDLALMQEIAAVTSIHANLSVPSLDRAAWRSTEPHTPNPRARLEAVAELNRAGIPTGVLIAPLMPGINDDPKQVEAILQAAADAGAVGVSGSALHLRGSVRTVFLDWLRSAHPELVGRYEELYERSAYAPPAERRRLLALLDQPVRVADGPAAVAGLPGASGAGTGRASAPFGDPELLRPLGPTGRGIRPSQREVLPPRRGRAGDPPGGRGGLGDGAGDPPGGRGGLGDGAGDPLDGRHGGGGAAAPARRRVPVQAALF